MFVALSRRYATPLEEDEERMTPLGVVDRSPAIAASLAACSVVVFRPIRSRRLRERYALLWLLTGLVLLGALGLARRAEHDRRLGRRHAATRPRCSSPSRLLFVLVVLLHYSTVISRLADQNMVLAQRLALLEDEAPAPRCRRGLGRSVTSTGGLTTHGSPCVWSSSQFAGDGDAVDPAARLRGLRRRRPARASSPTACVPKSVQ